MGLFQSIGNFLGIGKSDADKALEAQTRATQDANAVNKYMYDQTRTDMQPWRQAGTQALDQMQGSEYMQDFNMSNFVADPGYQFRMAEGTKALERSAAARGGLMGGGTMKALAGYGQNLASEEYNNAYNRFNADRDRRFNRLSSLAGVGQTATTQTNAAGQNYANSTSQNSIALGNAAAGAAAANSNNTNNLIGQGLMAGAMFCDVRLKTEIKPVSAAELAEMKRHLRAYKFKYKEAKHGQGDFIGVMAQDLEKSAYGRTLVVEDEHGNKQIDVGRVLMLFLATLAEG